MKSPTKHDIRYLTMEWQRPFSLEDIHELLTNLATASPRGPVIFEIRGKGGEQTKYLLGTEKKHQNKVRNLFKSSRGIRFYSPVPRDSVTQAVSLKVTKPMLALNTELAESVVRAGLAAINTLLPGEQVVMQLVLGPSHTPSELSRDVTDPNSNWLDVILGTAKTATRDQLKSMREKASQFSFDTEIRIGATGQYAKGSIASLLAGVRTFSASGVTITAKSCDPKLIDQTVIPLWKFPYRQRISVKELAALMLLPVGDYNYPTAKGLHPKLLFPPAWYQSPKSDARYDRTFAISEDNKHLSILPRDTLTHTYCIGGTGVGKSTAILNMALKDIAAGRSVIVIDPKYSLVNDLLQRIPEDRVDDVVILDPSDFSYPVGFNPLELHKGQNPALVADSILHVFQQVFPDIGITAVDTLSAALITLAQTKDANLLWLVPLLTDAVFREKVTRNLKDFALRDFWDSYNNLKENAQIKQIDSTLNRFRQYSLRPGIRGIISQSHPKFNLMDVFNKKKILLIPLNKGMIGSESAKLLGSLVVSLVWSLALSRADTPEQKRSTVIMYVDELQDYLGSLASDFSDALAQARGLGLGIVCAHQFRAQLSSEMRAGVDANCYNKILFNVSGTDAAELSRQIPELEPEDLIALPRYTVYTNIQHHGNATGWITAKTLPASEPIRLPSDLKARSQKRYGRPIEEIEREYLQMTKTQANHQSKSNLSNDSSRRKYDD